MGKTATLTQEQILYEAKWTAATRAVYYKAHPENFAGDADDYPIRDASDVGDAWGLAGHAASPDKVRRKIIRIAKRLGFTNSLPDTAKEFMKGDGKEDDEEANPKDLDGELTVDSKKQQESAATITNAVIKPRQKIATLRVCFLEYNARSLNGRIYPKVTCDRIYQSATRKLADSNSLPMTCFVSHEAANGNVNTELVGAPRRIWQEGNKFYADIDLADTRTAWDMLALAEGGYMRSESMRVLGVELMHDRNYDLPLVVVQEGVEPDLLGIDLTTRPGLVDTARIQQVLYESQKQDPFTEAFPLDAVHVDRSVTEKGSPMSIPIYLQVIAEHMDPQAHQKIHDHVAGVMDATCKPVHGTESARLIAAVEAELSEEGRAIAKQHAVRLAAAHDIAAHHAGLECEGAYNSALGIALDPDKDGDIHTGNDNDGDESHRSQSLKEEHMTPEQMMEALKAQGYAITVPKTKEQELQEQFEAKLAEQERKFNEALAKLQGNNQTNNTNTSNQPAQRQTQALGGGDDGTNNDFQPAYFMPQTYLEGKLHPRNWKALSNRRVPWPSDVDPDLALAELSELMEYKILEAQAGARGRSLREMIANNEVPEVA